MNDFITGLQFLTRIRLVNQSEWSPESFGRSVKYFPLIGAVIGMVLALLNQIIDGYLPLLGIYIPQHVAATVLIIALVIISGALHCDGFMDTMDGIFSGRSRERMLEIMKDSRVGANGVVSFSMLILLKWSLLLDISPTVMPVALFVMPVLARFAMVIGVTSFPYARPDGIGKAFAEYAGRTTLYIALVLTLLLVVPLGRHAVIAGGTAILFAFVFCRYVTQLLGGMTGDVYGAVTELTEAMVLFVFLF